MPSTEFIPIFAGGLVVVRWGAEAGLSWLNRRHVRLHSGAVPAAFRDSMEPEVYQKSVAYTLAKSRFGSLEDAWSTGILLAVLFTPVLQQLLSRFRDGWGAGAWIDALWLFAVGILLSFPSLPFEWWQQFRIEARFGFNQSDQRTWWMDRVKGFLLGAILGYPLLVLILKLVGWLGDHWWIAAWAVLLGFQLVMTVLAPILILPLFNKLTPLADGTLRDRLLRLGARTGFSARSILVMDGSKRSSHSNAFFTGFGSFRKIVLFDTLIDQLSEPELEAVLAHEVGHYKRGHIPRMLAVSAVSTLVAFWVIALLARNPGFTGAFGFPDGSGLAPALLCFALLSGTVTFWSGPLMNYWSRRHEYEADWYAAEAMGEITSLTGALRKLAGKNLSNLTPHPLFSAWHYSHPTLVERESALAGLSQGQAPNGAGSPVLEAPTIS
jgi:STE24 endopeptidase